MLWRQAGEMLAWPEAAAALAAMETDSVFVTWDRRPRLAAVGAGLASAPAAT